MLSRDRAMLRFLGFTRVSMQFMLLTYLQRGSAKQCNVGARCPLGARTTHGSVVGSDVNSLCCYGFLVVFEKPNQSSFTFT
jgi:hypothetical protein